MTLRRIVVIMAVVLAAQLTVGCGYRVAGGPGTTGEMLPGEAKSLYIPFFKNDTRRPGLEVILTEAVSDEFTAITRVVGRDMADASLEGVIKTYKLVPVAYSSADVVSEYRIEVTISIRLIDNRDGKVLWQNDHVYDEGEFAVDVGDVSFTKSAELSAFREMALDTARLIRERMAEELPVR